MAPQNEDEVVRLLRENNTLLRKMWRSAVFEFWFRILWYVVLIGLPFALYYFVLEPYFAAFGASFETFRSGLEELPGLKVLEGLRNGR